MDFEIKNGAIPTPRTLNYQHINIMTLHTVAPSRQLQDDAWECTGVTRLMRKAEKDDKGDAGHFLNVSCNISAIIFIFVLII